jgi:hypothetical protein
MTFFILVILVTAAAFSGGVMVAAWEQRRERAQRRKFEATLTASERQQWRSFKGAGGAWHEFAARIRAERKRDIHVGGLPRRTFLRQ